MDAKEAREKAYIVNTNESNGQYYEIKVKIEKEANSGGYYINHYESIKSDVKDKLESEGFKITDFFDQREGTTITIKW